MKIHGEEEEEEGASGYCVVLFCGEIKLSEMGARLQVQSPVKSKLKTTLPKSVFPLFFLP